MVALIHDFSCLQDYIVILTVKAAIGEEVIPSAAA